MWASGAQKSSVALFSVVLRARVSKENKTELQGNGTNMNWFLPALSGFLPPFHQDPKKCQGATDEETRTKEDWTKSLSAFCKGVGSPKWEGEDNSEIQLL